MAGGTATRQPRQQATDPKIRKRDRSQDPEDTVDETNHKSLKVNGDAVEIITNGSETETHTQVVTSEDIPALLSRITRILSDRDDIGVLSAPIPNGKKTTTMQAKLKRKAYTEAASYLEDLKLLCDTFVASSDATLETRKAAETIREFGRALVAKTIRPATESNGEATEILENDLIDGKRALMTKIGDAFAFSNAQTTAAIPDMKDLNGSGVESVVIHPGHPKTETATLSSIATPPASRSSISFPKIKAISLLEYDPYKAFAPALDSSTSLLSYEDSLSVQHSRALSSLVAQTCKDVAKEEQKKNGELPLEELAKAGFDAKAIAAAFSDNGVISQSKTPLQINADLIAQLAHMQEQRTILGQSEPSDQEKEIASLLSKRLAEAVGLRKASDFVDAKQISKAMNKIVRTDAVYMGTLPPEKPFGFATNVMHPAGFPPQSLVMPQTEKQIAKMLAGVQQMRQGQP